TRRSLPASRYSSLCRSAPVRPLIFSPSLSHPPDLPSFPTRRSSALGGANRTLACMTQSYHHHHRRNGSIHGYQLSSRVVFATYRSEEHTSELQTRFDLVCRLLLEKKKNLMSSRHEREQTLAGARVRF